MWLQVNFPTKSASNTMPSVTASISAVVPFTQLTPSSAPATVSTERIMNILKNFRCYYLPYHGIYFIIIIYASLCINILLYITKHQLDNSNSPNNVIHV